MSLIPRPRNPHRRAGNGHRDAGAWALAARAYRLHLDAHPEDVAIHIQLGHMEKEAGRPDAAEAAYRAASDRSPADPDPLLHLGHMLKQQGRHGDAITVFRRLFRLAPGDTATADELRRLVLRHERGRVARPGSAAFALDDLFAAARRGCGEVERAQARLALAMLGRAEGEAHAIVADQGTGGFLRIPDAALREILACAEGDAALPLATLLAEARLTAVPIALQAGCVIVLAGAFRRLPEGFAPYLPALDGGARLAAFVQEEALAAGDVPDPALAVLLRLADIVLAASDRTLDTLRRHVAERDGPPLSMASTGGDPVAGLRRAIAALPAWRPIEPVALAAGIAHRPGTATPSSAELLGPALAAAFYPPDATVAWMRGKAGELAFRVPGGAGERIVLLLAVEGAPWAAGARLGIATADVPAADRRALRLAAGRNLVRLEATAGADGLVVLLFDYAGWIEPLAEDHRRYAIGLNAIGWARVDDATGRAALRAATMAEGAAACLPGDPAGAAE